MSAGETTHDVYVRLSALPVERTIDYGGGVVIDLDAADCPVGVEVLDVLDVTIDGRRVRIEEAP